MDSAADPAAPARLTERDASGAPRLVAGAAPDDALARLAAYEDLRAELSARLAGTLAQVGELRAAGKVKTVTYRQLAANRATLRELLGYFEDRGL